MENASKALIIAGAILLAIVIISLGLIVVNNVRNVTDNTNLSEQEIQSFNAKFSAYEGDGVSASRVNTLIQQVIATNKALADEGKDTFVCISFPTVTYENETNKYVGVSYSKKKGQVAYIGSAKTDVTIGGSGQASLSWLCNFLKNDTGAVTSVSYALSVPTGKTYSVKMLYDDANGLVKGIEVHL